MRKEGIFLEYDLISDQLSTLIYFQWRTLRQSLKLVALIILLFSDYSELETCKTSFTFADFYF